MYQSSIVNIQCTIPFFYLEDYKKNIDNYIQFESVNSGTVYAYINSKHHIVCTCIKNKEEHKDKLLRQGLAKSIGEEALEKIKINHKKAKEWQVKENIERKEMKLKRHIYLLPKILKETVERGALMKEQLKRHKYICIGIPIERIAHYEQ